MHNESIIFVIVIHQNWKTKTIAKQQIGTSSCRSPKLSWSLIVCHLIPAQLSSKRFCLLAQLLLLVVKMLSKSQPSGDLQDSVGPGFCALRIDKPFLLNLGKRVSTELYKQQLQ